ncbi:MAG: hypothetical protein WKF71_04995 [Pyrinomonadaceae bacterium]
MADEFEEFYKNHEEPELTADEKELLAQMPEVSRVRRIKAQIFGTRGGRRAGFIRLAATGAGTSLSPNANA